MSVIYEAKIGSYLGLPIILEDGTLFGTLCAVDPKPYSFNDEEVEVLKSLSRILSNFLNENKNMVQFSKEEEARQLEKFNHIGRVAAGLAHEIGNPMQTIKGLIQHVFEDSNHHSDFKEIVMAEVTQVEKIISEFVLSIQPTSPVKTPTPIIELISAAVDSMKEQIFEQEILLEYEIEENLPNVLVEGKQIIRVITNLLKNALESVAYDAKIKINVSKDPFNFVVIDVIDNGKGIPTSIIKKVGTPFFTTKDYGTGLGLSVSKNIIRSHGGTLSVESGTNGTTVSIRLPSFI